MRLPALFLATALLAFGLPLHAGSVQQTQGAKASVANSCVLVTADSLAFGSYNPTSSVPVTASGTVRVRCTKSAIFSITPTSANSKTMVGSGGNLTYEIYRDAALTQVFGKTGSTFTLPSNTVAWFNGGITMAQYQANKAQYANQVILVTSTPVNGFTVFTNWLGNNISVIPGYQTAANSSTPIYSADATSFPKDYIQTPVGNQPLTGTSTSALTAVALTYYGQVPAKQDLKAGAVSDTVTLTVTF